MQAFLFVRTKRGVMVPGVLSEDRGNWDKNRGVTKAMHRIERYERFRAFHERVGPRILSLESVDYFGTSDYFSGLKTEQS